MSGVVKQETLYQYSVIHRPWVWRTITMGVLTSIDHVVKNLCIL